LRPDSLTVDYQEAHECRQHIKFAMRLMLKTVIAAKWLVRRLLTSEIVGSGRERKNFACHHKQNQSSGCWVVR
jgi:hypothetical protein